MSKAAYLENVTTEQLLNELATRQDARCEMCCGKWQAYFVGSTKFCHGCRKEEVKCTCGGYYNRNRGYSR